MRADGGEDDARDGRHSESAPCGEGIGRRSGGCGDDDAVGLRSGNKDVVAVDVEHAQEGGGAPVDHHLVQSDPAWRRRIDLRFGALSSLDPEANT